MIAAATLQETFLLLDDRDREGVGFISEGADECFLSYSRLLRQACGVLAVLQDYGLQPKDRVILVLNDNQQFLAAYWACILGGIVPAPLSFTANREQQNRLIHVQRIMDARAIITDAHMAGELTDFFRANGVLDGLASLLTIPVAALTEGDATLSGLARSNIDDPAYIQFSSGSTGSPKGVVLTHANLMANARAIIQGIDLTASDIGLSWMPLTHDMGLIGFHITPLVNGTTQYLMPTSLFVRRPLLWLESATRHRATIISSPNFGYKYFLDRFERTPRERLAFDLHRVRLVFNGAEPISAPLCRRFITSLKPYGLGSEVMFPVYGLAEASLAVTFPSVGSGLCTLSIDGRRTAIGDEITVCRPERPESVEIVGLGRPVDGCRVRIVDDEGGALPGDTAGRVVIQGANVSPGYWKDIAATADGWLDTGDVGFFSEGCLYITGRTKDLIFVRGQNFYAHDIERVAQEVPGITLGKTAAVGLRDDATDDHEVILFVAIRALCAPDFEQLKAEVIRHVNVTLGVRLTDVVMVDSIPRTSSGKIQRYKLEEVYRQNRI